MPGGCIIPSHSGICMGSLHCSKTSVVVFSIHQHCCAAAGNDYPTVSASIRLPKVLVMLRRGSRCFDLGYYFQGSPDIKTKVRGNETAAWSHFVFHGQFQDRAFRFICDDLDYAAVAAPPA